MFGLKSVKSIWKTWKTYSWKKGSNFSNQKLLLQYLKGKHGKLITIWRFQIIRMEVSVVKISKLNFYQPFFYVSLSILINKNKEVVTFYQIAFKEFSNIEWQFMMQTPWATDLVVICGKFEHKGQRSRYLFRKSFRKTSKE